MKYVFAAALSFVLGFVVGGFCFGFVHCTDCGGNVLGRAFVGIIFSVLTPVFGGFPPRNEGGVGEPFNVWPYIIPAWIVIFLLSTLLIRLREAAGQTRPKCPPQLPVSTLVDARRMTTTRFVVSATLWVVFGAAIHWMGLSSGEYTFRTVTLVMVGFAVPAYMIRELWRDWNAGPPPTKT